MNAVTASAASVLIPLAYAIEFAVLLAPGYAIARATADRFRLEPAAVPLLSYAATALAGYGAFWCFFANPVLGRVASLAWGLVAVIVLARVLRSGAPRHVALPYGLTFAAGAFYLAVLYVPSTAIGAAQRFFVLRPADNVLPQLFAEHLFQGVDPRHAFGDWLSSDRPPLQSGIDLLVRPVMEYVPATLAQGYEIAGIIAQLAWLPAVWLLCARAGFRGRRRAFVLAVTIFSGFCLYNTVYTWPKLLAAALALAALLFATPGGRANRDASLVLAGVCAALALLAHGSAVFFIGPALALAVAFRRVPLRPALAAAALAAIVLLLPWSAYQRFYDPPGDRLLKMHLAGIDNVDPRSAAVAIEHAYASTPPSRILRNKLANVATAVGDAPLLGSATTGEPAHPIDRWRMREREQVTFALGAANAGWLALAWWWWRRGPSGVARRAATELIVVALVSIAFWCLALWGPGATVTTHGAYAVELVLFVALSAAIAALPRPLPAIVLALAIGDLGITWIGGSLADAWRVAPAVDLVMVVTALLAALALGGLLAGVAGSDQNEPGASLSAG